VSFNHLGQEAADASPPPAGAFSRVPSISDDGRYVAFSSQADNLVPGDTNGLITDVFTRFVLAPIVEDASPPTLGAGPSTLTISGARFFSGVTVTVSGGGVAVDGVTRLDESTLLVDVTVADDAAPGSRTMGVANAGTGPGANAGGSTLCACLMVT
jgi:hypothetical protein